MISLRTTGWLKPVLSLGVAFGLSTASMAADSTANSGTANAGVGLADSGTTPAKPSTKHSTKGTKHPVKRKLVKHAKVKSLHGKMGRKKGASPRKGKPIHPPENKKSTGTTT